MLAQNAAADPVGEIGDYIICKPGNGEAKQAPCTLAFNEVKGSRYSAFRSISQGETIQ